MQRKYWILSAGLFFYNAINAQAQVPTLQEVVTKGNSTDRAIVLGNGTVSSTYSYGSTGVVFGTTTNHPLSLFANNATSMVLLPNGNIGMGSGSPIYKLHLYSAGNTNTTAAFLAGEYYGPSFGVKGNSPSYYALNVVNNVTAPEVSGAGANSLLYVRADGNVGVGTNAPAYKLDVNGAGNFSTGISTGGPGNTGYNPFRTVRMIGGSNYTAHFGMGAAGGAAITSQEGSNNRVVLIRSALTYPEYSPDGGNTLYPIWHGGNLPLSDLLRLSNGILASDLTMGTTAAQRDLNVNGKIKTRKVTVTQTNWPDYVFDSSYQLKPLHQVAQYIQQNKHLPDVPSAEAVHKNGVDIGDNQALLLKKIEELTLYIIQQNKDMQEMKDRIKVLEAKK